MEDEKLDSHNDDDGDNDDYDENEDLEEEIDRFMDVNEAYDLPVEEHELEGRDDIKRYPSNFYNVKGKFNVSRHSWIDH